MVKGVNNDKFHGCLLYFISYRMVESIVCCFFFFSPVILYSFSVLFITIEFVNLSLQTSLSLPLRSQFIILGSSCEIISD